MGPSVLAILVFLYLLGALKDLERELPGERRQNIQEVDASVPDGERLCALWPRVWSLADADVMPDNMWVTDVAEILGERCCEPHRLSRVRRKRGPGSAARQQFLVRGGFLIDDDESDTDSDASAVDPTPANRRGETPEEPQ